MLSLLERPLSHRLRDPHTLMLRRAGGAEFGPTWLGPISRALRLFRAAAQAEGAREGGARRGLHKDAAREGGARPPRGPRALVGGARPTLGPRAPAGGVRPPQGPRAGGRGEASTWTPSARGRGEASTWIPSAGGRGKASSGTRSPFRRDRPWW